MYKEIPGFARAQEGIIYLSPKGEIIRVNDAFKQILGYSADELINEKLFPGQQVFGDRDFHGMLLSTLKGQNIHYEIAHPHKDGHLVILDVKASMVEIENERIIIASFHDITFRKNAEKAQKQRTEDLANLADVSNALISTLEFDELLQKVVENSVKLYNLDTGAIYLIQGKELYLHSTTPPLPPDTPDLLRMAVIKDHAHIRKALTTGEPVAFADSSSERFTPEEQAIIDRQHLISCIYIPILIREKPIGILILGTTGRKKVFVSDEIMIYKMLSTKIGLVTENAMLFRERKKYIDDLENKNRDQQFLSKLAFDLAVLPADEDPVRFLLQEIRVYTNAVAAILTDYDPTSKYLIPSTILTDKKLLNRILKESGKKIVNIRAKVSDEMHRKMMNEVAIADTSLNSITLGAVPKYADKFLQQIAGIKFYCGITISMTGSLLGSLAIALKEKKSVLSKELMISIGHILSVNLQKRRAENELQIKETRLREIVRNISDVISIIDKEGKIVMISENVEKVLGNPVSHYLGRPGLEIIYPDDIPMMKKLLKELIRKPGIPMNIEVRKVCNNGGFKWVRGSAINLLGDPAINGILINFEDIDTIKKSEESLVKFSLGIERSPDAVFMTDPEGIITYINPAFTKIYGYTKEEALGSTPRILKSGVYPEKTYSLFWETLLSRHTIEGELVNRKKDGSLITIEGVNNPILSQKGDIIGFLGIHRNISLRKSREEALKLSEERFRKAFMTNPDAMNINRLKDGMYVDVNDGFTSLTGYSKEEVIGKTSFEINIWYDVEDRALLVKALKETAVNKNFELKIRLKNGKVKRCLMSSALIDYNGEKHIISIAHDIEEKKLMEDALKESEERFKQVIENADEWIWEVDSKGMYTYSSPIVEKILGYRPEELVGKKHLYDLFHPENRELMKKATARVFKEKGRFDKSINKFLNKNGETIFLEISGVPILNKRGKMIGYRGVDSDVTERIISEEKLRKLSLAVEQSPASIIITNTIGEIEYVNNRFIELTGYSWKELSGNNPRILKSGKTTDRDYKNLWDTIIAGKEWKGEFCNRKKNGEYFWESASISPILDAKGRITHFLGIKEDITEKKGAAKLMIEKIIETEERERMRYSNELHDGLGPIISTIKLYFQLLEEDADPKQKRLIIEKANSCIDEAIQSLKEISHNLSPNVVNNFGLITGIQSFINRLKETHVFEIDFKSDIKGRLERNVEVTLYRIVTEMINNTYKYACATKVIIDLKYSFAESLVTLQYMDNGKGFDLEKTRLKGRGLGISSMYQRVKAMNGRTIMKSEPGKGFSLIVEINSLIIN